MKRLSVLRQKLIQETHKLIDDEHEHLSLQHYLSGLSSRPSQLVSSELSPVKTAAERSIASESDHLSKLQEDRTLNKSKGVKIGYVNVLDQETNHLNLQNTLMNIQREYLAYESEKAQQQEQTVDIDSIEEDFTNALLKGDPQSQLQRDKHKRSEFINLLKKCRICSDSDMNYATKPFKLVKKLKDVRIMFERKSNNLEQQLKKSNMNKNKIIEDIKADRVVIRKTLPEMAKNYLSEIQQKQSPSRFNYPNQSLNSNSCNLKSEPSPETNLSGATNKLKKMLENNNNNNSSSKIKRNNYNNHSSRSYLRETKDVFLFDQQTNNTANSPQKQLNTEMESSISKRKVNHMLSASNSNSNFTESSNNKNRKNLFQSSSGGHLQLSSYLSGQNQKVQPVSPIQQVFNNPSNRNSMRMTNQTEDFNNSGIINSYLGSHKRSVLLPSGPLKSNFLSVNITNATTTPNQQSISRDINQSQPFFQSPKKQAFSSARLSQVGLIHLPIEHQSSQSSSVQQLLDQTKTQSSLMSRQLDCINNSSNDNNYNSNNNNNNISIERMQYVLFLRNQQNSNNNNPSTNLQNNINKNNNNSVNNLNKIVTSNSIIQSPQTQSSLNLLPQERISSGRINGSMNSKKNMQEGKKVIIKQQPSQGILANVYNFEEDEYFKHQHIYKFDQEKARSLMIKRNQTGVPQQSPFFQVKKSKFKKDETGMNNNNINNNNEDNNNQDSEDLLHDEYSSNDDSLPSATEAQLDNCYEESKKLQRKVLKASKGDLQTKIKSLLRIETVSNEIKQLTDWMMKK